jgi:hypothetical protein
MYVGMDGKVLMRSGGEKSKAAMMPLAAMH